MDFESLFSLSALVLACIPIAVGLVAAFKKMGLPSRFAPIVSIAVGMGLVSLTTSVWQIAVAQGLIVGLSASGLFDFGKKTILGVK